MKLKLALALVLASVAVVLFSGVSRSQSADGNVAPACAQPKGVVWEQVRECTYRLRVENGWLYNCFVNPEVQPATGSYPNGLVVPGIYTSVFVPDPACYGGRLRAE